MNDEAKVLPLARGLEYVPMNMLMSEWGRQFRRIFNRNATVITQTLFNTSYSAVQNGTGQQVREHMNVTLRRFWESLGVDVNDRLYIQNASPDEVVAQYNRILDLLNRSVLAHQEKKA